MKKNIPSLKTAAKTLLIATAATIAAASCDSTNDIGSSIVTDEAQVIVDSSFTVTGQSVQSPEVLSRTIMQLIGAVDAPDYGSISSEVVTQFMPATALDTTYVTAETIDSLKLILKLNNLAFTGDSLAPMGLDVYPLIKQLKTPMYSNFDATGYYDPNNKLGSTIYNMSYIGQPDSLENQYRQLAITLPVSIAQDFFNEYKRNPQTFNDPVTFAEYFPGLYFKNSYGSGRISRIANTTMLMYYHKAFKNDAGNDTTINLNATYFAVTPEIISNNNIDLVIAPEIKTRVANGENIILAPAGLDVEMTFPAREIIQSYKAGTKNALGVMNRLTMELPIEEIPNKYNIGCPTDILLILKKDREKFFMDNKTNDNITSFRATLDTSTGTYTFSDMLPYMLELMEKDEIADEDVSFVIVPITVNTETESSSYGQTSSYVVSIVPYVTEPKMGKFLFEKAKINFVYTRQTTIF